MTDPDAAAVERVARWLASHTTMARQLCDALAVELVREEIAPPCPVAGHDAPIAPGEEGCATAAPIQCPHCAWELLRRVDRLQEEFDAAVDREQGWKLQAQQTQARLAEAERALDGARKDYDALARDMDALHQEEDALQARLAEAERARKEWKEDAHVGCLRTEDDR